MRNIINFIPVLLVLTIACNKNHEEEHIPKKSESKEILISIPLSFFNVSAAKELFDDVKYLRTFGIDFQKPKKDNQYQYVNDQQLIEEFIQFTNQRKLEVIWTLNVTSYTLDTELAYVNALIKKGMNITAFEYGGEFYLSKYSLPDTSLKGVTEKVNPDIYLEMLNNWLPAFIKILPFSKGDHIIIGASHGNTSSERDQFRKQWNLHVINPLKVTYPQYIDSLSWSFHLYAGANTATEPNGEEDIIDMLNFDFLNDFPSKMKIFVTESGYYVNDFSDAELKKAFQFWTGVYDALRPGDVYGVHPLISKGLKPNALALFSKDGEITKVGACFKDWLSQRSDSEK